MFKNLINRIVGLFLIPLIACTQAPTPLVVEQPSMTFKSLDEHLKYIMDDMIKVVDGTQSVEDLPAKSAVYGDSSYFMPKGKPKNDNYLKTISFDEMPRIKDSSRNIILSLYFKRLSLQDNWNEGNLGLDDVSDHPISLNVKESTLTTNLKFKSLIPYKGISYFRTYETIGTHHPMTVSIAVDKPEPVNGMLQGVGGFSVERK